MKKVLSLLVVFVLVFALASCASLESYEKKLDKAGYEVEVLTEDEIADFADEFGLDPEEFGVKGILNAEHEEDEEYIVIIECDSKDNAEKLAEDLDAVLALAGADAVVDGKFVLAGTEEAIKVVE